MAVSLNDRSFNYGDGTFTTMQVQQGRIQLWPLHLQRLQHAAGVLGFTGINWQDVQQQAFAAAAAYTLTSQVLKLLLSRGEGGRGYATQGVSDARLYISSSSMPDYAAARLSGVCMQLAQLKLAVQPALAGLKHNNRLEQVLLKQELAGTDADELLVLDQQGYITEASAANVFFYRDNNWYTPELSRAGVAGVMRQHLLQQTQVTEVNWQLSELNHIDAMFICNALMGIVPVRMLADKALALKPVQQLSESLAW
ncbi:aminodeoxychorismate lyase [Rheinheimera sp. FR7-31]|uniref:aminodeoxychorismate lyase n=1 Tax=Rheinheimera fenheensis TaxID=3152295 RepID=UPI00325CC646